MLGGWWVDPSSPSPSCYCLHIHETSKTSLKWNVLQYWSLEANHIYLLQGYIRIRWHIVIQSSLDRTEPGNTFAHTYTQISQSFRTIWRSVPGSQRCHFFRFIVVGDFFRSLPQIKNCVEIKYHRYIEYTERIKYPSHPILYFPIQITEQCSIGLCQNTTYISYVIYIYKYLS